MQLEKQPPPQHPHCLCGQQVRLIAHLAGFASKLDKFFLEKRRVHTNKEQLIAESNVGVRSEGKNLCPPPSSSPPLVPMPRVILPECF